METTQSIPGARKDAGRHCTTLPSDKKAILLKQAKKDIQTQGCAVMITMHTTRPAVRPNGKPMSHRIRDARALLATESNKARQLLNAEAARVRNEATAKEAFTIPSVLLARVVMALFPGIVPKGSREYDTAAEVFRAEGWKVDDIATYLRTTAKRESLRQLSEILDSGAMRGPWVEGLRKILEAIDGFHGNMVVNSKRAWNDRIPAPQITYTPAAAEQEE